MFREWVGGAQIALIRNDDYWDDGKPYLDGIIISFVPNAASRSQALLAGQADFIGGSQFPANDADSVIASANAKIMTSGWPPNSLWGFFNLEREPFNDVKVRKALLMATNRPYIQETAFSGRGLYGNAPWTTQLPLTANPSMTYDDVYPFDYDRANKLLDEAGYERGADGTRFNISVLYDARFPERNVTALALQGMWSNIGVGVNATPADSSIIISQVHNEKNFDFYMASYNSNGDPAIGIGRAFAAATIGDNWGNASGYSNPIVDELFATAASQTDPEERAATYNLILPILIEDLPALTLHENKGIDAASSGLQGVWGYTGGGHWANAYFEK